MGSLCGGTNTTTTVNQPPQQVLDAYGRVVNRAEQVSNTPLQQYQGNQVAGFTPTQDAAFGRINTAVDAGAPYLDSARGYATAATAPVAWGPGALAPYMSPYHDAVVEATMANMDRNNAIQDQRIVGDAIKSGAWGGDRVDVARAELARAQGLAGAKTFADLNAANYGQAMGQFNTVDAANAARAQQGAYTFGQLGQLAQGQGLQGAGAMLGAGNLQQQLEQARLNVPLQQFMEARAYPFQTTQFLSGITTGLGSQMGGSSATTAPAPSMLQQLGGLGIAGVGLAGLLMSDGRAKGGAVPIGKSFSGDTIYRYHYHGDPETTHVGMIAQEVEQRDPGAVHDIGGVKFLDYD